ncbi:MAG: hypothetical protein HY329_25245 [Chloroflexi bacterium]|nr:hypothetical protein [Chloroflexota bacterium]
MRPELVYVGLQSAVGEDRHEAVRRRSGHVSQDELRELRQALTPWLESEDVSRSPTLVAPRYGEVLRVAVAPIGYEGGQGRVIVGSSRADFPRESEQLVLSVAANQAAIALQAARVAAER